jgi:hypothetical protein
MPVTIDGTAGTIDGVAAGGLPNSIILRPTIGGAGLIIQTSNHEFNTRLTVSGSSNLTYFTFNVTKIRADSILVVHGTTPVGGPSDNHGMYFFVSFGASRVFRGIVDGWRYHMETVGTSTAPGLITYNTASPTGIAAGTVTIGLGIQPATGSSNRPWAVINPNTSDDGRHNTGTSVTVYEITV